MEQKNMSVTEGREQERVSTGAAKEKEPESVSMGVLHEIKRQGMVWLAALAVSALITGGLCAYQMRINYLKDKMWMELFGSYDYVTQDGGGYNNVNTGTQGDVTNGSKSEDKD